MKQDDARRKNEAIEIAVQGIREMELQSKELESGSLDRLPLASGLFLSQPWMRNGCKNPPWSSWLALSSGSEHRWTGWPRNLILVLVPGAMSTPSWTTAVPKGTTSWYHFLLCHPHSSFPLPINIFPLFGTVMLHKTKLLCKKLYAAVLVIRNFQLYVPQWNTVGLLALVVQLICFRRKAHLRWVRVLMSFDR